MDRSGEQLSVSELDALLILLIIILISQRTEWDLPTLENWLSGRDWTPALIAEWQEFYHNAPRVSFSGWADDFVIEVLPRIPEYEDLELPKCEREAFTNTSTTISPEPTPSKRHPSIVDHGKQRHGGSQQHWCYYNDGEQRYSECQQHQCHYDDGEQRYSQCQQY